MGCMKVVFSIILIAFIVSCCAIFGLAVFVEISKLFNAWS